MNEDRLIEYLCELHENTPRQGPGCRESTEEAYRLCQGLPDNPSILDLGCGSGAQTLDLAGISTGRIIAVDFYQPFLDLLIREVQARGLGHRISPRLGDMADPPLDRDTESAFDLIWSEGAVFVIGFDQGLKLWRDLLKPGGCLALTEVSWLRPEAPQECQDFWEENYPAIRPVQANLDAAEKAGYQVLADFTIPERCWLEEYFAPLGSRVEEMGRKYRGDEEVQAMLEMTRKEVRIYEEYSDYYGYQFYVLRRGD